MNKKAYLRGIGAGMIVAAIVMGVSSARPMSDAEILRRAAEIEANESTVLAQISDGSDEVNKEIPDKEESDKETVSTETSTESDTSTSVSSETSTDNIVNEESGDKSDTQASTETSVEGNTDEADTQTSTETGDGTDKETAEETNAGTETSTDESELKEPEKIDPMPEGENGYTAGAEAVTIKIIKGDSSVSVSRRMFEAGLVESAAEFDKYLCANGYDKSISVGTYEIPYGLDFDSMARIIARKR